MTPEEFIELYPSIAELMTHLVDNDSSDFALKILEVVEQNSGFAYMAEYIAGHFHIIHASTLLTYYMSLIPNIQ